jgi:hypothetical protein
MGSDVCASTMEITCCQVSCANKGMPYDSSANVTSFQVSIVVDGELEKASHVYMRCLGWMECHVLKMFMPKRLVT